MARLMGIASLSDVAFMKRFAKCVGWFEWILEKINPKSIMNYQKPKGLETYTFMAVDASDVTEKGAMKRIWCLHYAIDLFSMTSLQYKITSKKTGESLKNFTIQPDSLVIGDRAYGSKTGIEYCQEKRGNFIFRIRNRAFKLYDENKKEITLLEKLKKATETEAVDIKVYMENSKKEWMELRVCAIKKTAEEIKKSKKRLDRQESKKQLKFSEETKRTHDYIFVITSLPKEIKADEILSVYRFRWQVELYFKRLKSILNFGDLPKKKEESVKAWLNGKLMVALLLEKLLSEVDFSPNG